MALESRHSAYPCPFVPFRPSVCLPRPTDRCQLAGLGCGQSWPDSKTARPPTRYTKDALALSATCLARDRVKLSVSGIIISCRMYGVAASLIKNFLQLPHQPF
ncbi:hypothetical protein CRV24_005296 [Beauveria bassiana]|nr:hypothetical protein CRV24_005296 [Beauveria bassiana]